jgi:ABC-type oligopeptide transport system ATPase subunit
VLKPKLILCDEPVSSLDVLVQAQVLNLFEKLRADLGLSYLFIAHDLALVKQVSDRVAVMYLGKLCEIGPVRDIYREPLHPYTLALLNSIPSPDPSAAKRDTGRPVISRCPRWPRARPPLAGRPLVMAELTPVSPQSPEIDHAIVNDLPRRRRSACRIRRA